MSRRLWRVNKKLAPTTVEASKPTPSETLNNNNFEAIDEQQTEEFSPVEKLGKIAPDGQTYRFAMQLVSPMENHEGAFYTYLGSAEIIVQDADTPNKPISVLPNEQYFPSLGENILSSILILMVLMTLSLLQTDGKSIIARLSCI